MKPFSWDPEKEALLTETRGVSFLQVRTEIMKGRFKIIKNVSSIHPNQEAYLVELEDYVHVVPFREDAESILLITIFPSRTWQKKIGGTL